MNKIIPLKLLENDKWRELYYMLKGVYCKTNEMNFPFSYDAFVRHFKKTFNDGSVENYILFNNQSIIALLELHLTDNDKSCNIRFFIQDTRSRYGNTIISFLEELKKRFFVIRVETHKVYIAKLLEKKDFLITNTLLYLKLKSKSNYQLPYSTVSSDFYFEFKYSLSSSEINQIAKVYNTGLVDMMRKDKTHIFKITPNELNDFFSSCIKFEKKILILLLKNKRNNIIGFTGATFLAKKPTSSEHFFTGIMEKYRNQKLAIQMKMKFYKYLFSEFPSIKQVTTDCYIDNIPIVKINKTLGFEVYNKVDELIYKRQYV